VNPTGVRAVGESAKASRERPERGSILLHASSARLEDWVGVPESFEVDEPFTWVKEHGSREYVEYPLAVAELARLARRKN
jgi:hypothetical protein